MWSVPWLFCFLLCVAKLGVGITTTKFASQVVKFCCDNVCVKNSVSEIMMKGYQLKRRL